MTRILMLLENNPYPRDARVRREATALTQAGHFVTVVAPKSAGQASFEMVNGVRVYRYPAPPEADGIVGYLVEYGYSLLMAWHIAWWVFWRHGFDVIHAHNPPDILVLVALPFKLLGKKFVFDHHDLSPEMYSALFDGDDSKPMVRLLRWFERLTMVSADHVISTNQSYKTIALERGGKQPHQVTVVRNGPDLTRLAITPADPALQQDGKLQLCYVGEMGKHDGLDYLMNALTELAHGLGRTDWHCWLIGGGDALADTKAAAKQQGIDHLCTFMGQVPFEQVARYLNSADICLAPEPSNPYNDRSTMIKITEYMAVGKPIVAFDLPEHRVTAQDAARYANANDVRDFARHIALLMDKEGCREALGKFGRKRAQETLAWPHQAKKLIAAYRQLGK